MENIKAIHSVGVNQLRKVLSYLAPEISVMIRGEKGTGKSSLMRQVATEIEKRRGISLKFLDRRLSQHTEGDIIGLPTINKKDNSTSFNIIDWLKQACNEPCFLFCDELNRASLEVQQMFFQIALDREFQGNKLHKDTYVVTAINIGANYMVNELDPALLDRFYVLDFEPTAQELVDFAKESKWFPQVTNFLESNPTYMDAHHNAAHTEVTPSRRSWDRLQRTLTANKIPSKDPSFYHLAVGFVGLEAASAFQDYCINADKQVTGIEILTKYDEIQDKIEGLGPQRLNILMEKVINCLINQELKDQMTCGQDAEGDWYFHRYLNDNFNKFFNSLNDELKLAFLINWKTRLQEWQEKTGQKEETIEDRFLTNRMVFNGGLEEIFMSGKASDMLKKIEDEKKAEEEAKKVAEEAKKTEEEAKKLVATDSSSQEEKETVAAFQTDSEEDDSDEEDNSDSDDDE